MKEVMSYSKLNHIWLHFTIFTEVEYWNNLFQDCLKDQVQDIKKDRFLKNIIWGINLGLRPSIRISLLVNSKKKQKIAKLWDSKVKSFLSKIATDNEGLSEDKPSFLFKPFPQNSIQFGIFDLESKAITFRNLDNTLSSVISSIFKSKQMSMDYLVIGIYTLLHSALCYFDKNFPIEVLNILKELEDDDIVLDRESKSALYEEESEIFDNIIKDSENFTLYTWQKIWLRYLENFFEDEESATVFEMEQIVAQLFRKIFKEVGLSLYLRQSLIYILNIHVNSNLSILTNEDSVVFEAT